MKKITLNSFLVFASFATLMLLGDLDDARAFDNNSALSVNNWAAEGNGRCSDYFDNSIILEASTNNMLSGMAIGPDTPEDEDADNEIIEFSVNAQDSSRIDFDSTDTTQTRVDAIILKNSRNINVFLEPPGGVIKDLSLGFPDGREITSIAFCYGLPSEQITVGEPIPACGADSNDGDPNNTATPDGLGDADGCESGETFECDLTVNEGVNLSVSCCACGGETLVICDPAVSGDCGFTMNSFSRILFGENGRWICFDTDSGDKCYYSNR